MMKFGLPGKARMLTFTYPLLERYAVILIVLSSQSLNERVALHMHECCCHFSSFQISENV
jgi:hypothetical protein